MRKRRKTALRAAGLLAVSVSLVAVAQERSALDHESSFKPRAASTTRQGVVKCANLIYASKKTSVCFADAFLRRSLPLTLLTMPRGLSIRLQYHANVCFVFSSLL